MDGITARRNEQVVDLCPTCIDAVSTYTDSVHIVNPMLNDEIREMKKRGFVLVKVDTAVIFPHGTDGNGPTVCVMAFWRELNPPVVVDGKDL